ncbi:MAG: anti-sigma factor [Gemmatimonadales bacterium]
MTGPDHDSPQELAAAYALGALPPDEARRFEAFLATSPETQREVAEYREVAALLALGGTHEAPHTDLRSRVLARVARDTAGPLPATPIGSTSRRPSPAVWIALAASLVLAVGLAAALVSTRVRLAAVETELRQGETRLAGARRQLTEQQATLQAILEPGVEMFQLTATGDPEPGIQLFWNRQRHEAVVHGFRLKPIPTGKAYQLWFIKDGAPVPSVTFRPSADGTARIEGVPVPEGGSVSAAAVTIEPERGSATPTLPIVMSGSLTRS